MKRILEKLRSCRPDEMERAILNKAQRNAYLFLVGALFLWSMWESVQVYRTHQRLNLLPCLLLVGAVAVQSLTQAVLRRRAVQGDEDSWETGPMIRLVLLVCALACAVLTAAAAVVLMAVRV